ncbi:PREDICTED: protein TIFY 4B-like isoform X2 [Tarenaya hassleriana]|uniref:protein TIFY 4B-like isoform X2 n=1 Tax=Tarenaya hassleriana TaxID=28532 RepID=UPI00053C0A7A|nr:PREDICTED: protein TIFY 4B-like isoform X2 [Tarenaya hassleriana]
MDAGKSPAKSILEKPLKHLTEEDISQLTREDCRKYLIEKGMRRPSWNKSQAIQQVLSLKALLEPGDDSGAGVLRKILVSQPETSRRVMSSSTEPTKDSGLVPLPEDDNFPYHGKDSPRSVELSGGSGQYAGEKDSYRTISPRSPGETNSTFGQLTIFYCGKVFVYDGVPPEKARSIMHMAASPIDLPGNDLFSGNPNLCSHTSHLQTTTESCGLFAPGGTMSKPISSDKMAEFPQYCPEKASRDSAEGQVNRKVSLQRYLEKRKDRKFSKGKKAQGVGSSSLEMYLSNQARLNAVYGQSNLGNTSSSPPQQPPPPGMARIFCDSPENQMRNSNLSVDLNSEDI